VKTLTNSDKLAILAKIKKLVLKYHINVGNVNYDAWAKALDAKALGCPPVKGRTWKMVFGPCSLT